MRRFDGAQTIARSRRADGSLRAAPTQQCSSVVAPQRDRSRYPGEAARKLHQPVRRGPAGQLAPVGQLQLAQPRGSRPSAARWTATVEDGPAAPAGHVHVEQDDIGQEPPDAVDGGGDVASPGKRVVLIPARSVAATAKPSSRPTPAPATPTNTDSRWTARRIWPRLAPTQRSRASSRVRWATVTESVTLTMNAPTSTATPPAMSITSRTRSIASSPGPSRSAVSLMISVPDTTATPTTTARPVAAARPGRARRPANTTRITSRCSSGHPAPASVVIPRKPRRCPVAAVLHDPEGFCPDNRAKSFRITVARNTAVSIA
jgi:hypothetical protein